MCVNNPMRDSRCFRSPDEEPFKVNSRSTSTGISLNLHHPGQSNNRGARGAYLSEMQRFCKHYPAPTVADKLT